MPMALRTRKYDDRFYEFIQQRRDGNGAAAVAGWSADPIATAVENGLERKARMRRELGLLDD